METTRRKLLTLLSSIPALGLFGAVGGTTKAERRIFYVDVGSLPKIKAEQYLRDMMALV